MAIKDAILDASMREMFEFARHMRKHPAASEITAGDLIEHMWSWAEGLEIEGAKAATAAGAAAATADKIDVDITEAPEKQQAGSVTPLAPLPLSADQEVPTDTADAASKEDAPASSQCDAPAPEKDAGADKGAAKGEEQDAKGEDDNAEDRPLTKEERRARRERRALEAARKQASAIAEKADDAKIAPIPANGKADGGDVTEKKPMT